MTKYSFHQKRLRRSKARKVWLVNSINLEVCTMKIQNKRLKEQPADNRRNFVLLWWLNDSIRGSHRCTKKKCTHYIFKICFTIIIIMTDQMLPLFWSTKPEWVQFGRCDKRFKPYRFHGHTRAFFNCPENRGRCNTSSNLPGRCRKASTGRVLLSTSLSLCAVNSVSLFLVSHVRRCVPQTK